MHDRSSLKQQAGLWFAPLLVVLAILSCTPEEIIAFRDSSNPDDPSIAARPVNSIVAPRLQGSNFRRTHIDSGFIANGHAQSWDGRIFIGRTNSSGIPGWYVHVFRPEKVERGPDGAPDFNPVPVSGSQRAFSPRNNDDALLLKLDDRALVGLDGSGINALAIVSHPDPSNPSLSGHPDFEYDVHHNPFPSDGSGNYQADGLFETYELLVHATKYGYAPDPKQTVTMDVRVVVAEPRTAEADVHHLEIVRNAEALQDTAGNPLVGIEPTLTFDGRLMVVHDGSQLRYSFNSDPTSITGWSPLRSVADMHHLDKDTLVAGETFQTRYPIAQRELIDHLGVPYAQGDIVHGAYPWITLDGTELAYTATKAGQDQATRGGFTINGVATKFQARHVDGPINDTRNALGPNDKTVLFVSSPGALPGFWYPFIDKVNALELPIPYSTLKPVLPLYQSNRQQYFEVPLEDALDGRYLTVLRMTEGIDRNRTYVVDIAPDTSGNGTHGHLEAGAAFPIEAGLGDQNLDVGLGRSVLIGGNGRIRIDDDPAFDRIGREFSAELFFMKRDSLAGAAAVPLCHREGAFGLWITADGQLIGSVRTTSDPTTDRFSAVQLESLPTDEYIHLVLTAKIDEANQLWIKLYQDGELLQEPAVFDLGAGHAELVRNDEPIFVGLDDATQLPANAYSIDDFKLSFIERDAEHIAESAYRNGLVDNRFDAAAIPAAMIRLGAELFHDPRLSKHGSISCATCHDPSLAFTDGLAVPAIGGTRNTSTVLNRRDTTRQFLDGRAASLEEQVLQPIFNPREMGNDRAALVRMLRTNYPGEFGAELGTAGALKLVSRSLASFVRSLEAPRTDYDRFVSGNESALSASEQRGLQLFHNKARCSACHNGESFSDELFHNTGFVDLLTVPVLDVGRSGGRFKTPTLRAIEHTAPYLHDGSVPDLETLVDLYDSGGVGPAGGADIEIKKLELTATEKTDLVSFLKAL